MPRIKKKHHEEVCWQKNLSVSAPSVPAEQFSTSVLAKQLSAIEVGVKKLHVVYAANDNFYQPAARGRLVYVYMYIHVRPHLSRAQ